MCSCYVFIVGDPIRWSESTFGYIQNGNSISISFVGVGIYIKCTGREDTVTECEQFNITYCSTITTVICSNMCTDGDVRLDPSYTSVGTCK